jgi:hypothetical protein
VQKTVWFGYDEPGDFAEALAPVVGTQGRGDPSQEEGMMANRRQANYKALILLIFFTMLFNSCAEPQRPRIVQRPSIQDTVVTEDLLTRAGFKPYSANMETPKTMALLNALPPGQITTFKGNGTVYHAYPDERSSLVYVGDQAAYQRYLALAQGRKVCRRVEAENSAGFWSCFDEFRQSGRAPR